ncbi:MAG: 3-deoxy-8-phosphooctulonate synthase [Defluviitaleaceae bacterium]|nr:3-deoxy-8-phosphooctulonate synthase [Defluviitaleaceae bacterium]
MTNVKSFHIDDCFEIGNGVLTLIGGPCSIESEDMCLKVAATVLDICKELGINYIFKSSFDKANRSSLNASRALGMEKGLKILSKIKKELSVPITTDVHEVWQCAEVGEVVDIIQIPAYLCRQTDLLIASAKTGKAVSVKKGQFMAPQNMDNAIKKITSVGNHKCILMERGTSFGYNKLVVDMPGLQIMREFGYPVFIDATHSVQEPGGNATYTKGNRDFAKLIMYSALAAGVDGVFAEIHPDPDNAASDVGSQLKLSEVREILKKAVLINDIAWQ